MMVYLAGDNNPDGAGVVDLGEMKQVGCTESVCLNWSSWEDIKVSQHQGFSAHSPRLSGGLMQQ
ncbi:MAG: hypothetical protein MZV70_34805 [Desulfobacterales bacterium]|nr:hypothetical protein [Desulfobacterales bacterium]